MSATFLLLMLLAVQPDPSDTDPPDDGIVPIGQPSDYVFCRGSGRFTLTVAAAPTEVRVGEPITLTLTFKATAAGQLPPLRPRLQRDARDTAATLEVLSKRDFTVEPPRPEDDRVRQRGPRPAAGDTYEFVYRLRPKHEAVRAVPEIPIVYYSPGVGNDPNLRWKRLPKEAIPLRVLPPEKFATPLVGPDIAFRHVAGPQVLERRATSTIPATATILAVLLLPPCLCVVWYRLWRRLWPDAERLARLRRSRAAAAALTVLHGLPRDPAERRADLAAAAVARYLHERLDLSTAEPTPAETAAHLERVGCPPPLTQRARTFFAACDAVRFGGAEPGDLTEPGVELIAAVEEETCHPSS